MEANNFSSYSVTLIILLKDILHKPKPDVTVGVQPGRMGRKVEDVDGARVVAVRSRLTLPVRDADPVHGGRRILQKAVARVHVLLPH